MLEFIVELFEFLEKRSKPSEKGNKNFHISQGVTEQLKKQLNTKKNARTEANRLLIAEITEIIEGCEPLLLEKWYIEINLAKNNIKIPSKKTGYDFKILMSSLMSASLLFPSAYAAQTSIKIGDLQSFSRNSLWELSVSRNEILKFPQSPIEVQFPEGNLKAYVEYLGSPAKPKISPQQLGSRPRLVSIGDELDFKESQKPLKIHQSLQSTETSQKFQNKENSRFLSLIESESFYDENEIGFKPISSVLFTEELQIESDEEINEFETAEEINEGEMQNDSKISVYWKKCDEVLNLKLFNGNENSNILARELVYSWKNKKSEIK
ncbi:unnamed protein product [Blepharisma stoltei]|uniref:Uncharacterized protein n=1 Tax=Blepharisma stoltei TaxID=1481888 RepID=A0AAU9K8F8_9CILI|nr:unnamed protein product [Blepharisma stoltei]